MVQSMFDLYNDMSRSKGAGSIPVPALSSNGRGNTLTQLSPRLQDELTRQSVYNIRKKDEILKQRNVQRPCMKSDSKRNESKECWDPCNRCDDA